MSPRLKRQCALIKHLNESNSKERKKIVEVVGKEFINTCRDCCLNILQGSVELPPQSLKKLRRHKAIIRGVADKKTNHKRARKLLLKGGFLNLLIPILAGVANSLLK